MKNRIRSNHPWWRRSTVAVITMASLVALLACAALSVDVGYMCALTAEQQNNADAAALAGAVALQSDGSIPVEDHVRMVLARNQQDQGYQSLGDQLIQIGTWDSVDNVFTPLESGAWGTQAFAVRVRAARNDVSLFFAGLIGQRTTDVWREAVAVGSRPCRGIWGLEGVRIFGNAATDSYASTSGPYDPEAAKNGGDICSGRAVDAMGSFDIHGDIMAGLGYSVNISGGGGVITGVTTSSPHGVERFEIDLSEIAGLSNRGDLAVTGQQTLTLEPGQHLFQSVTQRGGSSLTVSGASTIFVPGDVIIGGEGIVNATKDAANLTLIVLGRRVVLEGTSDFYGTVIAPNADVILSGTSDYYGMVIGRTLEMRGDFAFHVDESLPALDLIKPPPPMLVQ